MPDYSHLGPPADRVTPNIHGYHGVILPADHPLAPVTEAQKVALELADVSIQLGEIRSSLWLDLGPDLRAARAGLAELQQRLFLCAERLREGGE